MSELNNLDIANKRDEIIFGEKYNKDEYLGGVRYYENLSLKQLKQLIDIGSFDAEETQNSAPSCGEFLEFMEDYPQTTCHGYVVSPERSDFRFSMEGLECTKDITKDMIIDFLELNRCADELTANDDELYCWYD